MMCLALGLLLAQSAPHHLIFGRGKEWIILNENGVVVRAIGEFPPGIPEDVRDAAVSPDGTQLAVTAWLPSSQNVMLFLWDFNTGATHQIGDREGFHAAPSFSRDGRMLTFAHHPKKGGPPGAHQAGSYAQLYQQSLITLELKQITAVSGCHMESSGIGTRLYFAHADCLGGRRIEVLEGRDLTALTSYREANGEPSLSQDARKLVFTRDRGDEIELIELDIAHADSKQKALWTGPRQGTRFRPQYLRDGRVMFQNGAMVLLVTGAKVEVRFGFGGAK